MRALIAILLSLLLAAPAFAQTVSLQADPSTTSSVTYNLYRDGVRIQSNLSLPQALDAMVAGGTSHYYTMRAVDASGNESVDSNVAFITIPAPPPPNPNPGQPANPLVSMYLSTNTPLRVGTTVQLAAVAKYSDGTSSDVTPLVVWTSSNIKRLSISSTGLATVKTAGLVTITAALQVKAQVTTVR